jgi:hypothetical protein
VNQAGLAGAKIFYTNSANQSVSATSGADGSCALADAVRVTQINAPVGYGNRSLFRGSTLNGTGPEGKGNTFYLLRDNSTFSPLMKALLQNGLLRIEATCLSGESGFNGGAGLIKAQFDGADDKFKAFQASWADFARLSHNQIVFDSGHVERTSSFTSGCGYGSFRKSSRNWTSARRSGSLVCGWDTEYSGSAGNLQDQMRVFLHEEDRILVLAQNILPPPPSILSALNTYPIAQVDLDANAAAFCAIPGARVGDYYAAAMAATALQGSFVAPGAVDRGNLGSPHRRARADRTKLAPRRRFDRGDREKSSRQ